MKRYQTIQSIVTIILTIITVFSTVSVAAEPLSEEIKSNQDTYGSEVSDNEDAEFIEELIEKRDENTKHFYMSDGTIQAAQYSAPVHFQQNGQWVDYDNSLEEVDAEDEEDDNKKANNKDLTNRTADYNVRLSKKTNGKKFVRLEKDGYKISWYYTDANKSTAKVLENEKDDDPTTLENLSSTVLYEDVYTHTDFEYIVGSDGLKENIILTNNDSPAEFTSVYQINGLTPKQTDERTIELRANDDTVVYVITAPYMEDEAGETTDNIALSVLDIKNNTFCVKTLLDNEWLQAEEREYPVIVDPMLKTNQSPSGVESAFVSSKYPDKCYKEAGTDDMGSLYVGNIYEFGKTESYIKFTTLPSLDIADKVIDAKLYIGLRQCQLGLPVNVKRLVDDWSESSVTWNNGPYGDSFISDYMMLTEDTDTTKFREVEITDMVRGWYSGEYPNYGLSLTTTKTASAKAWFYSINYTTYPQNRPLLTVSYRNMSGYEDYWSYTETAAGRGGAASVNNFNGNFIFSQPITQDAGGNLMPVNLSVVYNSNKKNVNYSFLGNQIQTNYHIFLLKSSGELWDNGYKYSLNDSDGTTHWFYFENSSQTEGKDEDGLGYSLKVITVGSDNNEPNARYVITDKDENKMYFDTTGCLLRIKNPTNISSTLEYETVSSTKRIKLIKDGAGRAYTFGYSSSQPNLITSITDPAGRKTQFTYSSNRLTNIAFADGKSIQLSYSSNMLCEIKGIDNTRTKINYDSSSQKRVTSIDWGVSSSELLEKYSFSYKQNETTVTDLQNRSYTYQFNDFGQTTGTVSNTDGSAQFFELNKGSSTSNKANKLISESRVLQSTTNYIQNPGFIRSLSDGYWTYMNDTTGASITIDTSKRCITRQSVKISKPSSNTGRVNAVQTINDLPAGTYTLSAYVFTNGSTIPGDGVQMFAEVHKAGNGDYLYSKTIEKTTITNGWERRSVTFEVPEGGTVRATMGLGPNAYGTVWFDDVQLEKSENASTYNLVENSSFTNGLKNWDTWSSESASVTWAGLSGFANCAKLTGSVENQYNRQRQVLFVPGTKGEVCAIGAWAFANSAPMNNTKADDDYTPIFKIALDYYDNNGNWLGCISKEFNPDVRNAWQFLADEIVMPCDYGNVSIVFTYDHNVNAAYHTGSFCYKEQYGQTYDYDSNGNVVSVVDLAKSNSTFSYYGNQMAKMLNPSGSKYLYSYNDQKQLTYSLSSDGQEYGFTYDDKGNVTKSEITARKPATEIESNKKYIIVNAYSGLSLNSGTSGTERESSKTRQYNPGATEQQWKAELISGTSDIFAFKATRFSNRYLDVRDGSDTNGALLQIHAWNNTDAQKFKLVKQADGSFGIFTQTTNYSKCLDAQHDSTEITSSRAVEQATCDKNNLKEWQKWYLYPVEETMDKSIVTETTYTESKNFVSSSKDQLGNETTYSYNEAKGTLQSVTDANGNETEYTYDSNNNSLLSVSSGGVTNSYSYNNDRLSSINVNGGVQYSFVYDKYGRTAANKVGNGTNWLTLSTLEYNNAGLMSKQTYGNGDYVDFSYDSLDRITEKRYNGNSSQRIAYSYGNNGSVSQITDYYANTSTRFVYDLADRVVSQREFTGTNKSGGTLRSSTDFTYADKTNYLTGIKHYSALGTQNIGYRYGNLSAGEMPDQIYSVSWNGNEKVSYTYDALGRLTNKKIASFNNLYSYQDVDEGRTTTLVNSVQTPAGTYTYTYDGIGNILSLTDGTYTTSYEYDSLNQLTRVNDEKSGKTYTYSYSNGNITEQKEYAYTTGELGEAVDTKTWSYGNSTWSDLLTSYNGEQIVYDEIGNPLTIGNKELTWLGRQLLGITEGESTVSYTYNGDGQRTSKTVNGVNTEYIYNGEILAGQKTGNDIIVFMYDNNSDAFGFIYNSTEYYYIKNAQNDVTAIADSNGNVLARYYYDAWGKVLEITGNTEIAGLNPIRYRSYYYDAETGWYYLNTRYYSADMCRFINADGSIGENKDILSNNLFAYCSNDPINNYDINGQGKIRNWLKSLWHNFKTSTSAQMNVLMNGIKAAISTTFASVNKIYKSTPRPSNIGKGAFSKQVSSKVGKISSANKVVKSSAVGVAIDVGSSIVGDVIDQAPANKVFNNAMAELMFGVAGMAVGYCAASVSLSLMFAMSSVIAIANPFGVAIAINGIAAVAFGLIVDYVPIDGMSIKDRVKKDFNEAG